MWPLFWTNWTNHQKCGLFRSSPIKTEVMSGLRCIKKAHDLKQLPPFLKQPSTFHPGWSSLRAPPTRSAGVSAVALDPGHPHRTDFVAGGAGTRRNARAFGANRAIGTYWNSLDKTKLPASECATRSSANQHWFGSTWQWKSSRFVGFRWSRRLRVHITLHAWNLH